MYTSCRLEALQMFVSKGTVYSNFINSHFVKFPLHQFPLCHLPLWEFEFPLWSIEKVGRYRGVIPGYTVESELY